mgnify:CR=1 FL=1
MTSIPRTSQTRKLIVLGVFFVGWLWADLWTKDWADSQLADPRHPLAVETTKKDVGKTAEAVVRETLGLGDGRDADQALQHIARLPAHESLKGEEPIYTSDSRLEGVGTVYVYWREDRNLAPRRLERSERLLVNRWLSWAEPEADPETELNSSHDG